MDRRRFLGTLAGVLAAPLDVRAQPQGGKVYRVGTLFSASREDAVPRVAALQRGLVSLGYIPGQNLVFVHRYADDAKLTRVAEPAAELIQAGVDVVVTATNPTTAAMMKATSSVPIVMAVGVEPVSAGLVASIARPGSNVTGSPSTWTRPSSRPSAWRSSRSSCPRLRGSPSSGTPPMARRASALRGRKPRAATRGMP